MPDRPLPVPTPETEEFWEACKRGEFLYRHCRRCDRPYHFPRSICPFCWRSDVEWRKASGLGHVYSYAIHYRSRPGIAAPYVTVMVTLIEGPRILTLLEGVDPEPSQIAVGMPVRLTFEKIDEAITLYKARPVQADGSSQPV